MNVFSTNSAYPHHTTSGYQQKPLVLINQYIMQGWNVDQVGIQHLSQLIFVTKFSNEEKTLIADLISIIIGLYLSQNNDDEAYDAVIERAITFFSPAVHEHVELAQYSLIPTYFVFVILCDFRDNHRDIRPALQIIFDILNTKRDRILVYLLMLSDNIRCEIVNCFMKHYLQYNTPFINFNSTCNELGHKYNGYTATMIAMSLWLLNMEKNDQLVLDQLLLCQLNLQRIPGIRSCNILELTLYNWCKDNLPESQRGIMYLHVMNKLITSGMRFTFKINDHHQRLLKEAMHNRCFQLVKLIVKDNSQIILKSQSNAFALALATKNTEFIDEIMKLSKGQHRTFNYINQDTDPIDSTTSTYLTFTKDSNFIIDQLLKIITLDEITDTHLQFASICIEFLDFQVLDKYAYNILFKSVSYGYESIVRDILVRGINIQEFLTWSDFMDKPDELRHDEMFVAILSDSRIIQNGIVSSHTIKCIRMLIENGADIYHPKLSKYHDRAFRADNQEFEEVLGDFLNKIDTPSECKPETKKTNGLALMFKKAMKSIKK